MAHQTRNQNVVNSGIHNTAVQSSQFLEVPYLALTGLIYSSLPAAGSWAVAGKALFYLAKLGPSSGGPCPYLLLPLPLLKGQHITIGILTGLVHFLFWMEYYPGPVALNKETITQ
ncbi:hypothetical protein DSO57_1006163 [Entomophthora muscae]|uniref:Uncharacterized protein n=1 Tax=Entomophthora muscae TaxID=34485 RepID=A0ACC2UT09_9FUNG|nr:hypothetical protein DSO57_1006163 [Entomophthora muscae]